MMVLLGYGNGIGKESKKPYYCLETISDGANSKNYSSVGECGMRIYLDEATYNQLTPEHIGQSFTPRFSFGPFGRAVCSGIDFE